MSLLCVTTSANLVDRLRDILNDLHLNDPTRRLKFLKDESLVAIPIINTDAQNVYGSEYLKERITSHQKCDFEENCFHITKLDLPVSKKLSVKTPHQLMKNQLQKIVKRHGYEWTEEVNKDIASHWERHGDIVLIPGTSFTLQLWTDIGTDIWLAVTKCLSCKRLARKLPVSVDGYRTPQVMMLYGENTWVEHIDNGIRYTYDVVKCMFSAGNITEKLRVAGFNCENEVVVDLYAGIGYFTLPYLVYTGVKHLHACEWNPDAVEALQRNLKLNRVEDRCTIHKGDNKKVCPKDVADRVNLGLIPSSREGWPVACAALKSHSGGILHIHYNVNTKPRTDNHGNISQSAEPHEIFRCEARSQVCVDSATSVNTFCHQISWKQNNGTVNVIDSDDREAYIADRTCDSTAKHTDTIDKTCDATGKRTDITDKTCNPTDKHIATTDKTCDATDKHTYTTDKTCDATDKRTDITNKTCDSTDKNHDTYITNSINETDYKDREDKDKNRKRCKRQENAVKGSKWYSWAVITAQEIKDILETLHDTHWNTTILHIEHVKSYAPYVDHVVLDLDCRPCL